MHEEETNESHHQHWTRCPICLGQGKIQKEPTKKRLREYQNALHIYEASGSNGTPPQCPAPHTDACPVCKGSGLRPSAHVVPADPDRYPHIAIIGGGIGGSALALACLHRGIPFTLYEKDANEGARSQGYGLTLQQASKAIESFGIFNFEGGITSTRHVVFNTEGKMIGEWGLRKWQTPFIEKTTKRKNVHVSRQTLRTSLLKELGTNVPIEWGHRLVSFSETKSGGHELIFQVGEEQKTAHADLLVGADGIRSVVRELLIEEDVSPLQYLGCIVILGICPLSSLSEVSSPLLDSATVFQMVNGHERIYMMPYDNDHIMWQLSFPLTEEEAKALSKKGARAMKEEGLSRLQGWHEPIPQILKATAEAQITGYPVYDRELFDPSLLEGKGSVTLLGDSAHPMSPFKGQGANQALLDALSLARMITKVCDADSQWREKGLREVVLHDYEHQMAKRSASKVQDSAKAAKLLHSPEVLKEGNAPRGRI